MAEPKKETVRSALPQRPETTPGFQNDGAKHDIARIPLPSRTPALPPRRSPPTITPPSPVNTSNPIISSHRPPVLPPKCRDFTDPPSPAKAGRRPARSIQGGDKSTPTRRCASSTRELRRRFGPARSDNVFGGGHRATCASHRRHIQCNQCVRFHSETALLGIAWHFRAYFSHPNLELRVILNSWKTPPPLRP